jgi:tRNA 2-thiouridine synthesizing protein E
MQRTFTVGDLVLDVDEDGFIQEPALWNEAVAGALARTEGVDVLSDDHWSVVRFLREYFVQNNMAPPIRRLIRATGFDLQKIYQLFPTGPAKGACKVAGLPKPVGCV